jgi:hypothetical protein
MSLRRGATQSAREAAESLGGLKLKVVQAALRKTTETLAQELAHPGKTAPGWSELEWMLARAVTTMHGVSPLLSRRLKWPGPAGWREFLSEQYTHTRVRHMRLQKLLDLIDAETRDAGIAIVPLKGSALHALGIYGAGERPMADLDLLARSEDAAALGNLLEKLGFREKFASSRHRVFEPDDGATPGAFGENSSNPIKIELHTHIGENLPLRTVDISPRIFPRRPHPGLNSYPSKAALMTHLLLHAAGSMAFRAIRLINLHDISQLSDRMTDEDWDELLTQERTLDQTVWWAFPPLALTTRYYGCVPEHVLEAASTRCQWVLKAACSRRNLSDVSLSHIWISAFPGLEWARSLNEAVKYAARRIVPSVETRSLRPETVIAQPDTKEMNAMQPGAAQLEVAASSWAQLSQSRRLLRWLTSRPPRPETLGPVRGALAQWT